MNLSVLGLRVKGAGAFREDFHWVQKHGQIPQHSTGTQIHPNLLNLRAWSLFVGTIQRGGSSNYLDLLWQQQSVFSDTMEGQKEFLKAETYIKHGRIHNFYGSSPYDSLP